MRPYLTISLLLLLPLLLAGSPTLGESDDPASAPYGFRDLEIYKLDRGIFGLRTADADGDGRLDLFVVNNAKARIDVLLRREKAVKPAAKIGKVETNPIGEDRFFERKRVLTEKTVSAMIVHDLNGDEKVDIAYYGKPAELVIAYGDGKGGFDETRRFDVKSGSRSRGALDAGDLDGDGRDDLALLAEDHTAVFLQDAEGRLQTPVKLPHAVKNPSGLEVMDVDGDGLDDLVQIAFREPRPLRVRYQQEGGQLGPETSYELPPLRTIGLETLDDRPGVEVLAIQKTSGFLRTLGLSPRAAGGGATIPLGSIQVHPFDAARGGKKRALAVGDVDGDGHTDVVVGDPGTAQVSLYLQTRDGRLGSPRRFPSLAENEALEIVDLLGDARGEVAVLSTKEKAVGVSTPDAQGRLPFPVLLDVPGTPKALAVGDANGDGRRDLAVLTAHEKGFKVAVFAGSPDAKTMPEPSIHALPGMTERKDRPESILLMDFDRDGNCDILVIDSYKTMRAFRQKEGGTFEDVSTGAGYRAGLVSKKRPRDVNPVDLDGDGKLELLVTDKNFARSLVLDGEGTLQIHDQVNGRSPSSLIRGAVSVDLTGDGKPEVALLDGKDDVVTVLRRGEDGVFVEAASFPAPGFKFERLIARDMNGDGRDDLVVVGSGRFGVMYSGGADRDLKELHSFETPLKDAFLAGYGIGDLNGDGRKDLALTDGSGNRIEIVSYDAEKGFAHEISWRVFEEKRHRGRSGARGEPREIQVGDVDGDGKDDVILICHDRVIVYPQG